MKDRFDSGVVALMAKVRGKAIEPLTDIRNRSDAAISVRGQERSAERSQATVKGRDAAPGRKRHVPPGCPPAAIRGVIPLARCAGIAPRGIPDGLAAGGQQSGFVYPLKALGGLLLGFLTVALAGCMEIETVVRVNPDGSGTITEHVVMSNEIVQMMTEMAPEGQPAELINEQELWDAAQGYGDGVELVSIAEVETNFGSGYEASYAFVDINLIRVGQKPGGNMPGNAGMGGESEEGGFTTFSMQPGYPAALTIYWPVDENGSGTVETTEAPSVEESNAAQSPKQQQAAMEMMNMAFKDMRMSIHIDVAGQVVDSNATHLDGSRVTLVDIAFAEFLDNAEAMAAMVSNKEQTVADMKDMMRLIPGLKMEIEPEITVLFE